MISRERQKELNDEYANMCDKYPSKGCLKVNARGETDECPYSKISECEKAFFYEKGKEDAIKEQWIKVEWHEVTDKEREENFISQDIDYILDCKLPEDNEEILIVRKWKGGYITEHDENGIDEGYYLESGIDWKDVIAWMPLPQFKITH